MSVPIQALGIDRLSVRERLDLVEPIGDSLPDQVHPDEVPAWHRAERARRGAGADASPRVGQPWREAQQVRGRLAGQSRA